MTKKHFNGVLLGGVSFLLLLILWANWGFSAGRYLLFMDELVSFDGVRAFYTRQAWKEWYELITVGGDVRYGRIFWYFPALLAALPTVLWGAKAQIIVTRLIVAVLQLCSFYLLVSTFIKSKTVQYISLLFLLVLPFTPYYMTMPKPEPYVLLFLTVFLLIWTQMPSKRRMAFFCLGVAFGAKVSVLPFMLYFFLLYVVFEALKKSVKSIINAGLSLCAGAIVGNPYLLRVLSPSGIRQSINDVAANAAHGSDSSSITIGSWLHFILTDYFFSPPLLVGIFLSSIIVIPLVYTFYFVIKQKQFQALISDPAIISFFMAMSFILPVILRIKRLWGMYLHLGFVFLLVSSIIIIYQYKNHFKIKPLYRNFLGVLICVFLLFESTSVTAEYIKIGRRDQSLIHQQKEHEYQYLKILFDEAYIRKGERVNVLIDPHLYSFNSSDTVNIIRFWGPFIRFNEGADIIAIYEKNTYKKRLIGLSEQDVEYTNFLESKRKTEAFLQESSNRDFFYVKNDTALKDVVIYTKKYRKKTLKED